MRAFKTNYKMKEFALLSRKVAAEGAVLIKNDNETLPIHSSDTVAVFGRMQLDWYRCGTGSGGSVNVPYKTNLIDSLREVNVSVDEDLATCYASWVKKNPIDVGGSGWACEPWFQKEMTIDDDLVRNATKKSNKAIVVIGRTAGEDKDNLDEPGSYRLTDDEMIILKTVANHFTRMIVVLNVSNIIDMKWINDDDLVGSIKSIIYTWHGGMEGGRAAADILSGKVTPSGKLTDTIAFNLSDYPSDSNYNHPRKNIYQEDIYVGYRYFETFCPEKVQFEFGYGLSYTKFKITTDKIDSQQQNNFDRIDFLITVENIGNYDGKEVVQLYYEAPQGKLGKPSRILGAFTKTKLLQPGEKEHLTLSICVEEMASYDERGVSKKPSSYVLEEGTYKFHIGNSVKNAKQLVLENWTGYEVLENTIVYQCEEVLTPTDSFKRIKPGALNDDKTYKLIYEEVPIQTISLKERIIKNMPLELKQTGDKGYKLHEVHSGDISIGNFISQLTDEELATLVRGEGMGSSWVTPGTASAFGGISRKLYEYGIPIACTADGPSGIRMESGRKATQIPIGTLLSASWNLEIVEDLFQMVGFEMCLNEIDILLGPSLNIRRHPLNGRNFEYYSEDPLISGLFAAAATRGISSGGGLATIKHFVCNNQERERHTVNAVVSERALREIYMKGFEIAVKKGGASAVMTSYNPINGHWAASNYDLTTTVLRNEWSFNGLVMTDWWAKMNDPIHGGIPAKSYTNHMIRSQNDVYMVTNNFGAEINIGNDNTLTSLENGTLTRSELQRSAMNICNFLMKTKAFFSNKGFVEHVQEFNPDPNLISTIKQDMSTNIKINISIDNDNVFYVSESGEYRIYVTIKCNSSNIAQTECNVILNNKRMCLIQTNGTNGEWITQKLVKVKISKGFYNLTFEFIKKGLEMESLEFIKE